MPILGSRMTEPWGQKRDAHRVHNLCTGRAPILCLVLFFGASAAQAGTAWDMFVARCLDPFEHQALPVVDGLAAQPVDQMHEARRVYGPSAEGYLLVIDAAPTVGERACIVEWARKDMSGAASAWRSAQLAEGRYTPEGAWMVSHEWIEPRVMVRSEATDARTIHVVVETDLES